MEMEPLEDKFFTELLWVDMRDHGVPSRQEPRARGWVVKMPASEAFYEAMVSRLKRTADPKVIDQLLDFWNQCTYGATEYDAELWGFPEDWMLKEREVMENRIKSVALIKSQGI